MFLLKFQEESRPLIKPIKLGYSQLSKWLSWSSQADSIFSSFYEDLIKCQTKVRLQILYCTGHSSYSPGKNKSKVLESGLMRVFLVNLCWKSYECSRNNVGCLWNQNSWRQLPFVSVPYENASTEKLTQNRTDTLYTIWTLYLIYNVN